MNTSDNLIIIAIILTTLGFILLISGNTQRLNQLLTTYHLIPEPERLTELYFSNHIKLPSVGQPNSHLTFQFNIRNREYKSMTYRYEIMAESTESGRKLLDEGAITLDHDDLTTINKDITLSSVSGRTRIVVNLVDRNQPIHFWINVR